MGIGNKIADKVFGAPPSVITDGATAIIRNATGPISKTGVMDSLTEKGIKITGIGGYAVDRALRQSDLHVVRHGSHADVDGGPRENTFLKTARSPW